MFGRATIMLGIGPHSSFSFFPRLISAVADWMSTILHTWCGLSANLGCRSDTCCTQLAENTGCKKLPKIRHLDTIAQLCQKQTGNLVWCIDD